VDRHIRQFYPRIVDRNGIGFMGTHTLPELLEQRWRRLARWPRRLLAIAAVLVGAAWITSFLLWPILTWAVLQQWVAGNARPTIARRGVHSCSRHPLVRSVKAVVKSPRQPKLQSFLCSTALR
jgi:hypothetical protein